MVDVIALIKVFDRDGNFLGRSWTTPDYRNGRPSGLSIDRDGNLLLSDSHYHCLRVYSPEGVELRTIRGQAGSAPGQRPYVTQTLQDATRDFHFPEVSQNPPHSHH